MKLKSILVIALCVCVFSVSLQAGDTCGDAGKTCKSEKAKTPTTAPATAKAPTTAPAKVMPTPELTLPAKLPDVAATVGKETISGKEINEEMVKAQSQMQKRLESVPPQQQMMAAAYFQKQLDGSPLQVRNSKIFQILLEAYLIEKNIPCPEEKVKELKEELVKAAEKEGTTLEKMMEEKGITEDLIKKAVQSEILQEQAASKEKIDALVKAHPEYFNGTIVQASHILIPCDAIAATVDQKAALDKLKKIRADIEAKKVTFEEAAAKYSSCPSKSKGGDLGEFTADKMAPGFSIAAFALKPEEISPIVRTQFGFHIVKLIKRTDGTEKIDPEKLSPKTEKMAKGILLSQVQDQIVDLGMAKMPIVINK